MWVKGAGGGEGKGERGEGEGEGGGGGGGEGEGERGEFTHYFLVFFSLLPLYPIPLSLPSRYLPS